MLNIFVIYKEFENFSGVEDGFLEEGVDIHNGEVIAKTTALDHDQVLSWFRGVCFQRTKTPEFVVRILDQLRHLGEVSGSVVPGVGEHVGPLEDASSAGICECRRVPTREDWVETFILPGAHDYGATAY